METDISAFPAALDLFAFAQAQQACSGEIPLANLPRVAQEVFPGMLEQHAPFTYSLVGRFALSEDGSPQWGLSLHIKAALWLECQRCLAPCEQIFDIHTQFRIVKTEEDADAAPLEDDCDVIAGSTQFDVLHFLEEEILLALPIVPKHADGDPQCYAHDGAEAGSLSEGAKDPIEDVLAKNPFSILLKLKSSDDS